MLPCFELGGDFYDFIPLGDHSVGITVADVVGKGISNYSAEELRKVQGLKSADARSVVPRATEEAVHRDYFVLG